MFCYNDVFLTPFGSVRRPSKSFKKCFVQNCVANVVGAHSKESTRSVALLNRVFHPGSPALPPTPSHVFRYATALALPLSFIIARMAPKRTDVENARQQRARAELMQDSPHILKLFDEVVEREQARDREFYAKQRNRRTQRIMMQRSAAAEKAAAEKAALGIHDG